MTQEIDISEAGIPWAFRALIWLIDRFGDTEGKSSMELLKQAVEEAIEV